MIRTKIISVFIAVFVSASSQFAWSSSAQLIDSLRSSLSQQPTPSDSLRVLYDIYDLTPTAERIHILGELHNVAQRAGNEKALLDIIRRSASFYATSDSMSLYWDSQLMDMPPSRERDETLLYMNIQRFVYSVKNQTSDERIAEITKLITDDSDTDDSDLHEDYLKKIRRLYTLVIYLATETNGHMLTDYIGQLGDLIEEVELYALRNQYYTHAANSYTRLGMAPKAIEADRKLLECIDLLDKEKKAIGRNHCDYSPNRYICYRRMLYNSSALSEDEIEECFAMLGRLAESSDELAKIYRDDDIAKAYYYSAVGKYSEALPHIKAALKRTDLPLHRETSLLAMLRDAYSKTGDKIGELLALRDYNNILARYNEENITNKYRELQIKYDVHKLKSENAALELEKRDTTLLFTRISLILTILGLATAAVLLIILRRYYRRSRAYARALAHTIDILEEERDQLKQTQRELIAARDKAESANLAKDDFLHNMSHELRTPLNAVVGFSQVILRKMPMGLRASMSLYSEQINRNAEQLENIIDDVLYLSSFNPKIGENIIEPVTVGRILDEIYNRASQSMHNKKVELCIDRKVENAEFETDRKKLIQVLGKIVDNAIKFTNEGYVAISAEIEEDGKLSFVVTDTGCGIPEDKEEMIFDRFTKLDRFSPGAGLGLYIARQVAGTLGATITIDKTYSNGACFVITLANTVVNIDVDRETVSVPESYTSK